MIGLLTTLKAALLTGTRFTARYGRLLMLGVALLLGGLALRGCYKAGRQQQAARDTPTLSARQARRLSAANVVLHHQATRIEHQKDSVVARVRVSDQRIIHAEHQVDSLTHVYEQVPAVVALHADAELFDHLIRYRPSPFPDTTGY